MRAAGEADDGAATDPHTAPAPSYGVAPHAKAV